MVDCLTHFVQSVNELVHKHFLKADALLFKRLDLRQVRFEFVWVMLAEHYVHLIDLVRVLFSSKLGFVFDKHAMLRHRLHLLDVELTSLEGQHLLLYTQVGLLCDFLLHLVDVFGLFYFLVAIGEL
jgi:hypothetical protein